MGCTGGRTLGATAGSEDPHPVPIHRQGVCLDAGRLLGASKQSWKAVFITGVSGWLVALAVSTTIVRGDIEKNPSLQQLSFLLMLLFIMLATVVYEVWVKPGRRRIRPGVSIPHPIRMIKRRY